MTAPLATFEKYISNKNFSMIRIYNTIETILICYQCNNARAMPFKYNLIIKIKSLNLNSSVFCFSLVRGSFYFLHIRLCGLSSVQVLVHLC